MINSITAALLVLAGAFAPTEPLPQIEYEYRETIPVLMYHEISDEGTNYLYVSPDEFDAHLEYIHENGYTPVTLKQVYYHWEKGIPLPQKPIVLTFDDGYRSMYTRVLPKLQEYGYRATFFIISGTVWSDWALSKDMIREMSAAGMEIGSHGHTHQQMTGCTAEELTQELFGSKQELEEIIGKPVLSICYPEGRHNDAVIEAAKAAGYACGVVTLYGIANESQGVYTLNRIRVCRGDTAEQLGERIEGRLGDTAVLIYN